MKQTNNAIKFLMAQYRAIFNNAYFKGLATAAVVTVGLAAGQAQAAADANLTADELSAITGTDIIITGGSETGDNNKWGALQISGGKTADIQQNLTISGGAVASNYITSDDKQASTVTGKDLTINVDSKNKATHGLTIKAGTSSGATAVFNKADVKVGVLAINAADSAAAGALSAKTINVGTAAVAGNQGKAATEPNATINLGKSATLGIAFDSDKSVDDFSTINLNADGKISALSGDGVTNTINAAVLNIKGGSLEVQAKSDGSSGATTTLNLASGSMDGGSIVVNKSAALTVGFDDNDIKLQAGGEEKLTKQFNLNSGELVAKGNITQGRRI